MIGPFIKLQAHRNFLLGLYQIPPTSTCGPPERSDVDSPTTQVHYRPFMYKIEFKFTNKKLEKEKGKLPTGRASEMKPQRKEYRQI